MSNPTQTGVAMKPLVIYHGPDCLDGFTAAWVTLGPGGLGYPDFHPASYGSPPPDVTGRDVYIVDFSYPREVLLKMHAEARSIIVLDHHKSAEAGLVGLDFCRFDMSESGASMSWSHFRPDEPIPQLVQYVKDRDLWRWEMPHSRAVNAWLRSQELTWDNWSHIAWQLEPDGSEDSEAEIDAIRREGAAILRDQHKEIAAHCRYPSAITLDGVEFRAVNCSHSSLYSEVAGALAGATGAGAIWKSGPKGALWSLRSAGIVDVSIVAQAYGGGGHHNAAGFRIGLRQHALLLSALSIPPSGALPVIKGE